MTEQENRVIVGLECCIEPSMDCKEKCPYYNTKQHVWMDCYDKLMSDALALIKAQEPRVLGLDEIHRGMAVWLEDVDKEDVVLAIGGSSCGEAKCFITEYDLGVSALDSEYGIRWRAWTAKPTMEQRTEEKWNAKA